MVGGAKKSTVKPGKENQMTKVEEEKGGTGQGGSKFMTLCPFLGKNFPELSERCVTLEERSPLC